MTGFTERGERETTGGATGCTSQAIRKLLDGKSRYVDDSHGYDSEASRSTFLVELVDFDPVQGLAGLGISVYS